MVCGMVFECFWCSTQLCVLTNFFGVPLPFLTFISFCIPAYWRAQSMGQRLPAMAHTTILCPLQDWSWIKSVSFATSLRGSGTCMLLGWRFVSLTALSSISDGSLFLHLFAIMQLRGMWDAPFTSLQCKNELWLRIKAAQPFMYMIFSTLKWKSVNWEAVTRWICHRLLCTGSFGQSPSRCSRFWVIVWGCKPILRSFHW